MISQNPVIGRASGSLSNIICQTIYDKNVIRSKPVKVRDAKSTGQISQRSKLSTVMRFITPQMYIFRNSFANQVNNNSVYNAVVSYYMRNLLEWSGSQWTIFYECLKYSFGSIIV
jgi:hypothetical protein